MAGTILQVNVKSKVRDERGLPKYAVKHSYATKQGLNGDYNIYCQTKKKCNKDMAILVYSMETIQELNQEGWPVQPGDVGENLTVKGYAHDSFKVGQQYIAGNSTIEISLECDPCTNLGLLPYVGQKHIKTFMNTILHRRGWYARIVKEGEIKPGDSFNLSQIHSKTSHSQGLRNRYGRND
jgi:MOSC domain-containing protein YiiM